MQYMIPAHVLSLHRATERRLVLRSDLVAGELLDSFLRTVHLLARFKDQAIGMVTYTSPRATMQTVCQIPRPILGVTPR